MPERSTDRRCGKEAENGDTWEVEMMPQAEERGAVPNIGPQFASEWREELFRAAAQRALLDQGMGKRAP